MVKELSEQVEEYVKVKKVSLKESVSKVVSKAEKGLVKEQKLAKEIKQYLTLSGEDGNTMSVGDFIEEQKLIESEVDWLMMNEL